MSIRNASARLTEKAFSFLTGLAAISVFALFLSVADLALGRNGRFPLAPTAAAPLLMLPFIFLVIMRQLLQKKPFSELFSLFIEARAVIYSFLFLAAMSLAGGFVSTSFWGEESRWIFLISYGFLIFFFSFVVVILPSIRSAFRTAAFVSLALVLGSLVYDLHNPGFFSIIGGRAGGFPGNSNFGALVVNMLCASVLAYEPKRYGWQDFPVLTASGLGVFMTQSRSGMLCFVALFLYYAICGLSRGKIDVKRVFVLLLGPLFVISMLFSGGSYVLETSTALSARESRFVRYFSAGTIEDDSSSARLGAVFDALKHIQKAPVMGRGTGFSRRLEVLPHNIYLNQWLNNGLFGLLAYVALLLTAFIKFREERLHQGKAFILVVFLGGFFTHNILEERTFLMLLGGLLSIAAMNSLQRRKIIHAASVLRPKQPEGYASVSPRQDSSQTRMQVQDREGHAVPA